MECLAYNNCNHKYCNEEFCLRKYKIDMLLTLAKFSNRQKQDIPLYIDKDNTDLEAFTNLSKYAENIERHVQNGDNLYIHSSICGNGKTSWAIKIAQKYIMKIWAKADLTCHVLFISVPTYLDALKRGFNEYDEYSEYISKNVYSADLVIFDDIASKTGSNYDIDKLFSIVNKRYQDGKSNIFTSNLTNDELANAIGPRLASRVANEAANVELFGRDKRELRYINN